MTSDSREITTTALALFLKGLVNPRLIAPLKRGAVVGKIEIRQGGKVLKQTDVVALEAVEKGGFFRRAWDSIVLFFKGLSG